MVQELGREAAAADALRGLSPSELAQVEGGGYVVNGVIQAVRQFTVDVVTEPVRFMDPR
jgi:hypothetical protein